MMRFNVILMALYLLFTVQHGIHPEYHYKPTHFVNFISLLINPKAYSGMTVKTIAYLDMYNPNIGGMYTPFLCMSRSAAENMTDNCIFVSPNHNMLSHKSKINDMYVMISGTIRILPSTHGNWAAVLDKITSCKFWSDPSMPKEKVTQVLMLHAKKKYE